MTHKPGNRLEVTIEKIVPRGLGLAFAEGLTIFVPLSAPGDRVLVEIERIKKRSAMAEVIEVIAPSPQRAKPPCPYFGVCGGCDFQQLTYEAQLAAKAEMIRDCLVRIGKLDIESVTAIPSPEPLGYRSRARWQIDGDLHKLGYYRRNSHEVIDVAECPILTRGLQETLTDVRNDLGSEELRIDRASLEAANDGTRTSLFSNSMDGEPAELEAEAAGERFRYSAGTFFQANRSLADRLVKTAIDGAAGKFAIDLYSGVGVFALPLARRFESVTAIEESTAAARFCRANAVSSGLANLSVKRSAVRDALRQIKGDIDLILLDPPRSGPENGTIERIAEMRPAKISYVSCEPSILARDLRVIVAAGYTIDSITGLDLFPQTHHVETVARLSRNFSERISLP